MKKIILLTSLALVTGEAIALDKGGIFVEPMVTYERGRGEIDYPSPFGSSDVDVDGFGVGARLGLHIFESLFVGIDGRYSMPKFEEDEFNLDADSKSWNYGPVLGLQMPFLVGLRAWGGWIMGGEIDPESESGINAKFESANGYRLGGGLKVGLASLNLEYQSITYDESNISGAGGGVSLKDSELDNNSWVLSVSFPLSL